MGSLYFRTDSPEVEKHYQEWYKETKNKIISERGWIFWWRFPSNEWNEITTKIRVDIATQLSESKRKGWFNALYEAYSPDLGFGVFTLIKDFLYGDMSGLLKELANNNYRNIKEQFLEQIEEIKHAQTKIEKQIKEKILELTQLEQEFLQVGYGREKKYAPDLSRVCLKVPANVRHDEERLAYGGVLILPRIKAVEKTDPRYSQMMNNAFGKNTQTTSSVELARVRAANSREGSVSGENNPAFFQRKQAADRARDWERRKAEEQVQAQRDAQAKKESAGHDGNKNKYSFSGLNNRASSEASGRFGGSSRGGGSNWYGTAGSSKAGGSANSSKGRSSGGGNSSGSGSDNEENGGRSSPPATSFGGWYKKAEKKTYPLREEERASFVQKKEVPSTQESAKGPSKTEKYEYTQTSRLKAEQLPREGKVRFIPRDDWNPNDPDRGPNGKGFKDKYGNIWVSGPSRTKGQKFEWDVQLSDKGRQMFGWASRDGKHINVSLDGKITHR
ncbi:hypothetical protein NOVO_05495 [Rickettsiales bacterium Ac37b]|nr:hypothetical protein NOVO_05495 [Rickettsiales bacterium Ac37b]